EVGRRRHDGIGQRRAGRGLIADRNFHGGLRDLDRVQDRQVVGAQLGGAVDRTEGVDGGLAPVGEGQVVDVVLRGEPVVYGHDEIALHAVRPWRYRARQIAGADAISPLRQATDVAVVRRIVNADRPTQGASA